MCLIVDSAGKGHGLGRECCHRLCGHWSDPVWPLRKGQVILTVIVPDGVFSSEQLNIIIFVNRESDFVGFRARHIRSFNGAFKGELHPGLVDDA